MAWTSGPSTCEVICLSFGLQIPNQANWLMRKAPASRCGAAAGMLTSAIFLGQFASPLFAGPFSSAIGLGSTCGVAAALLVGLAVALLVTAASPTS